MSSELLITTNIYDHDLKQWSQLMALNQRLEKWWLEIIIFMP